MLDYRIDTFLMVCELMNYHKTADALGLTQPAVTQQIRHLERKYDCKLFDYHNNRLQKTYSCILLEQYARATRLKEKQLKKQLSAEPIRELRIGATKTVGDYFLPDHIHRFLSTETNALNLIVDNTTKLLALLQENQLDFAVVEGFFDKTQYDSILLRREPFVGICRKDHPFCGKEVNLEELLHETIIHREAGSGTRAILEKELSAYNESLQRFQRRINISSFKLILDMVKRGHGISFVYKILADSDPELGQFTLQNTNIIREFNIVYLKYADMHENITYFFSQEVFP